MAVLPGCESFSAETVATGDEADLIQVVHARPVLWDTTHERYLDEASTTEAWQQVARLRHDTVSGVQQKWQRLRSCFGRHRKKLRHEGKAPTWQLYGMMSFIDEHVKERNATTRVTSSPASSTSSPRCSVCGTEGQRSTATSESSASGGGGDASKEQQFGKHVVAALRDMGEQKKNEAMMHIEQVLRNA